jgi:hypothetical protein
MQRIKQRFRRFFFNLAFFAYNLFLLNTFSDEFVALVCIITFNKNSYLVMEIGVKMNYVKKIR